MFTLVSRLSFRRTTTADRNFMSFDPNGRNVVDHGQKNNVKADRRRVQRRPNWTNLDQECCPLVAASSVGQKQNSSIKYDAWPCFHGDKTTKNEFDFEEFSPSSALLTLLEGSPGEGSWSRSLESWRRSISGFCLHNKSCSPVTVKCTCSDSQQATINV